MRRQGRGQAAVPGNRGRVWNLSGPLLVVLLGLLCFVVEAAAAWVPPHRPSAAMGTRARSKGELRAALTLGSDNAGGGEEGAGAMSKRLQKARLRLAEAQGIIPAGSSDRYQSPGGVQVRFATASVDRPICVYTPVDLIHSLMHLFIHPSIHRTTHRNSARPRCGT